MKKYRDINDDEIMTRDEWIKEMQDCNLDLEAAIQLVDDDIKMGILQEVK